MKNSPQLFTRIIFSLVALVTSLPSVALAQASLNYLGDLGGKFSIANGINDSGQIVGQAGTTLVNTGFAPTSAFLYTSSTGMVDIGDVVNGTGSATAINNAGQVAGWSYNGQTEQSYIYASATGQQLIPSAALTVTANAINSSGQVAGLFSASGLFTSGFQGFVYSSATGIQGIGPISLTSAQGINDAGQVTGSAFSGETYHAFLYSSQNGFQQLSLPAGYTGSQATAINASGQIAGSLLNGSLSSAFIYSNATGVLNLGTGNASTSTANAINNLGDVVGSLNTNFFSFSGGMQEKAFLYTADGGVQELNQLYASLLVSSTGAQAGFTTLLEANGINDEGQIVGEGEYYDGNGTPYQSAFLLDTQPVPEPRGWALDGVCLLAFLLVSKWRDSRAGL